MRPELTANQEWWDSVVAGHARSEFYDLDGFRAGASSLAGLERRLLGDVSGRRILHLQCHLGLDTLSLARLGASVTGVDFSRKAVDTARALCDELGLAAEFVCCDVYDTREHVEGFFDVVYASYGAVPWLPDIQAWADVVAGCIKPDGRLLVIDQHPVAQIFSGSSARDLRVQRSYFDRGFVAVTGPGSYVDGVEVEEQTTYEWHRPLADIVSALVGSGLTLDVLEEHAHVPFRWFDDMVHDPQSGWRLPGDPIPLLYAIGAGGGMQGNSP